MDVQRRSLPSHIPLRPLPQAVKLFHFSAGVLATFGGVLGFLGLLGWVVDSIPLRSLMSGEITMKTNTAIALTLTGVSVLLLLRARAGALRRAMGKACAGVTLLLGAMTLMQYSTGVNLGIDQLVFREPPGSPATYSPNRMGIPAATSFTMMGLALLLLDVETRTGKRPGQYAAVVVCLLTLLPILGYVYSVESLYGRPGTGIAAQTAVALASLAIAILCARSSAGVMRIVTADGPGGVLARGMIVPTIIIPVFLGWVRTVADEQHWVSPSMGRTLLIMAIVLIFTILVWWNAHGVARVGHERLLTEEALRQSTQRFRVALNTAPVSVYTNDREMRYTWIHNPRPGFTPDALIGKRDDELLPRESVAELMALKARVLESGRGERQQIGTTIDGTRFVYDVSAEPLRGPDGEVTGLTVAALDVTSIRQNEEALLRANAEAEKARTTAEAASAAKDQFLAVLSHELRTPLTPVMTLVQLLEKDETLTTSVRECLRTIRRNIELEARLIDDLLDLTRITHGKLALRNEEVDVHEVLQHVLAMCSPDADAKRISLAARLAPERFIAKGDSARLQQVFWNLLKNAIKFTPAGGEISVVTEASPGGMRLMVKDTGIGIAPEVLPRIFNAFDQGDPAVARQFGGLGLGLAISKALVAMHGGTIEAASKGTGSGTAMRVMLPATVGNVREAGNAPVGTLPVDGLRGLHVLVVEDNPDTARALTRLLGTFGCRVTVATTVRTASQALQAHRFDVLLSDLGLPDGSGHELMGHLRAQQVAIKAIAVSGFGMEQDVKKSLAVGFAAHLIKPIDIHQLHKTLLEVVGKPSWPPAGMGGAEPVQPAVS